jgi:phage terminase large subunit-like protein
MDVYDEGALDLTLDDVPAGTRCWIGVDLSATIDLTAVVALFELARGPPLKSCEVEAPQPPR